MQTVETPAATAATADPWDWFDHITDSDRDYLFHAPRVRPVRCVWCWKAGGQHTPACQEMHDEWASKMPFGKHKDKPVASVPRDYLEWLMSKKPDLPVDLKDEIVRVLSNP